MPKADQTIPPETLRSTTKGRPLLGLALVGALLSAAHTHANETQQVVSSNGTTNIVERIDFPVGDIKDIIPAGDKYIIHANPIDSLKDSVAVDALFVMEKANPDAAFGRTFSDEITSVAYVPSLDMAVWSYKTQKNTDLLELKNGESALHAAGSNKSLNVPTPQKISANVELFSSISNVVHEVGSSHKDHVFAFQNDQYVRSSAMGTGYLGSTRKVTTKNEDALFVSIPDDSERFEIYTFNGSGSSHTIPSMGLPTSLAAVKLGEQMNGTLIFGYDNGTAKTYYYNGDILQDGVNSTQILAAPINSMTVTGNQTIQMVSTNSNEVVEVSPSLGSRNAMIPNTQEIGYRKVISDGNSTLLLSNTHSNCFYRIQKTR